MSRIQNRLYIVINRTNVTSQLKQFFMNSICIINEYNDIWSINDAEELKAMIANFTKSTS